MADNYYTISIDKPQGDLESKISGKVTIQESGAKRKALASVVNLPYPYTNTTNSKQVSSSTLETNTDLVESSLEDILNSIRFIISSEINDIWGINIPAIRIILTPEVKKIEDTKSEKTSTDLKSEETIQNNSNTNVNNNRDPKSINTKITLKVKSGPGELIGEVEKDVTNGEVDFTGLQFDKPGEYIILAIPSSSEFDTTEFKINVEPEEDVIPQDDSRGSEEVKSDGSRPIIAQIDQPSVKLEPMKYDTSNSKKLNEDVTTNLGYTPFFWYNSFQVEEKYIKYLEIYYDGAVPKAKVILGDPTGIMTSPEGRPLDDAKFEIFLNSGSDNLKSIHLKFKLEQDQLNKRDNSSTIVGTLDLKDFYKINQKSYNGTSFEALRSISKELQLGFNSNINNTDDKMVWKGTNRIFKDFLLDIVRHSYITDESFMIGYIDFYWCFNYVDIEKEWKRDVTNDVGLSSQGITSMDKSPELSKISPLVLTNDVAENSTCFYFNRHQLNNNSTKQSIKKGQFTKSIAYDRLSKTFQIFDVDSQSSSGSTTHILKGSPGDKDELNTNFRTKYSGKIDTENTHKNYLYAETQNRINLDNLVRISVDMDLPQPNFNLYKFQKVRINFINNKQTATDPKFFDERLTGEWIIIDIRYIWERGALKQTIKAVRKELGKTKEEMEKQSVENKNQNNSELNENPVTEDAFKPNSLYEEGKQYTIEKDGKRYIITVTKILDNGVDITATIKELI
jgi:hypothetical protein